MGKKIAKETDPILQRLNGAEQPEVVEATTMPGDDPDPILQQLNQVKKKDDTVSAPSSTDGFTGLMPAGSLGVSKKPSEPSEKSGENPKSIGLLDTWKAIKNELIQSYKTPQKEKKQDPLLNAMKRGWMSGETAEIINPFKKEVTNEDLKKVSDFQKQVQELPASKAYSEFNESKTFGEAIKKLAQSPAEIITEITVESMSGIVNYGATRIAAGAGTGAAMGSVVPGIGTLGGAGAGIIAGLSDTSLALEYSSAFLESLQKAGVDLTDADQLQKAFEDDKTISEARSYGLKKGIPVAIFDLISGGVAGKISSKPAKTILNKVGQYGAEFGVQAAAGGTGEFAGQMIAGQELSPSAIIAEMVGELGTTPIEVSANLLGKVNKKISDTRSVTDVVKEEQKNVNPNDVSALDTSAEAIQEKVEVSEQEVITPEVKPLTNETVQTQIEETGTPQPATGELSEATATETTQAEAEVADESKVTAPTPNRLGLQSIVDNQTEETKVKAATFASPNEQENLTFEQASTNLSTPQQEVFNLTSKILADEVGIKSDVQNAIGDWSDGAENSVVEEITGEVDFDTVRYMAAVKGNMANQKAVIPFIADSNGNDAVHTVTVKDTIANVRKKLDEAGVQFRTLIENKDGVKVVIFDPKLENAEKVGQFADSYGTKEQTNYGTGEFLGSETREGAIERYGEVIDSFEKKEGRRKGLASEISSLYRDNLAKVSGPSIQGKSIKGTAFHANTGNSKNNENIYLADETLADAYSVDDEIVERVNYDLKNAFIVDSDEKAKVINDLIDKYESVNPKSNWHPDTTTYVNNELKKLGYDGLVIDKKALESEYGYNTIGSSYGAPQIILFSRNSIVKKSPTKSETTKPVSEKKPAPKERKFATQVLEDPNVSKEVKKGLSEDAKTYVPKGISITDQEAKAIIEVKGPEQATSDFLDRTNEMTEDTRAVLGQNLIRHYNQIQDFDSAVKVADNLAKWYTDLGRAVNAGKVFQMLTPEGILRYVSKEITKAKANYSKKTSGSRKRSKDAIDFINKQAVEKVLSDPKIKKRISTEVKKGRVKQAIDFLEKLKIDTKGKALDITYGLTAEAWNTLITAVQKGLEAGLTISQAINKSLNKVKSKDFDSAGAKTYLSDQLKDYRVELDPELAIREELKTRNDKIDNIIREHYTVVDEKKRSLVDKLVKDANLSEEQAEVVSKDLSREFDRLTREAKERALRKYLPKEKKTNKAAKKDLIDTIIEASNVGALSDQQYKDVISEKIGVKSISAEEAKKITGLAEKVQTSKEGFDKGRATQRLLDYISTIEGYSAIDVGMSIWYANILSGLSTQVLNISANFTETVGEAYVAAVMNPKEFGWIFKGLFSGWGRGFLEAMDTMQHGFQPTKFEQKISTSPILERVTFKGGPWNPYNYLKHVTRLMNAADIFFYQGINEMRSRELAVKLAKKEGKAKADKSVVKRAKELIYKGEKPWSDALEAAKTEGWTGRDLKRRAYEILEQQRPEFLIKDSNDAAARGTFNYDPEGTLGALTSLVNLASEKVNIGGLKPIKFIIPFTRIISNVANRYLDWTPVGLLRAAKGGIGFKSLGENLHREYTPEERAKVLTKAMTGIIGFTALYALTDEDDGPFEITADGTGDVFKNYELQETGWRPYSIKINGTWYEYKNTPLAIPMATLGYLRDLGKYRGQKDIEAKTSIVLFGTMKYIMDLSFLQSLSAFFDTFSKDNTSSADSFFKKSTKRAESTVKSFVIPNAFTQVSRSIQEVMDLPIKRANSFGDQIIRDLPILRDRLGNIYDALGDPVIPNQTERFLPLKPSKSTEEKERLWALIADNGAWIGRPGRGTLKPNGEGLTDTEYDEFSLLAGKLTKQKLLLEYYFLSQLNDKEEVKTEIRRLKSEARKEARDTLFGFEIF